MFILADMFEDRIYLNCSEYTLIPDHRYQYRGNKIDGGARFGGNAIM
jgi:hypothetical protein